METFFDQHSQFLHFFLKVHTSCVTAISVDTGKVLDFEALNQAYKQCDLNEHLDMDSQKYRRWRADHNTRKANFKGSAHAMKTEGVVYPSVGSFLLNRCKIVRVQYEFMLLQRHPNLWIVITAT